ncbi:MAG: maleylpyruvate isomerase family mycothiol-dependent enzyme [Chitinophagaceae bacterium]
MQTIPIPTIHLFAALDEQLIQLLHSLSAADWQKPTIAKLWSVKDVAAHLLDGNIRTLSMLRDNHFADAPGNIFTNEDLVNYLNGLNAEWVHAMKRISPQLLVTLLETTGRECSEQLALLPPFATALFAVTWAGETSSLNWFHTAREYTERWHHQQQIRDAVGMQGIMTRDLYYPVLDTFMMALPHAYRHINAAENTVVQITISGEAGGVWWLIKKETWILSKTNERVVAAHTTIDASVAWKLFTKSWRKKEVMEYVGMEGDVVLGQPVLDMISVMA